jgi:hypothetical protein
MNRSENSVAFGAPGIGPRWTSSAKKKASSQPIIPVEFWLAGRMKRRINLSPNVPRTTKPYTRKNITTK